MDETFIVAGLWFIGFSVILSGLWISTELHDLCRIKNELDSIRLELQYGSIHDKNSD